MKVVASKNGKYYHRLNCKYAKIMNPVNRIDDSKSNMRRKGYKACCYCNTIRHKFQSEEHVIKEEMKELGKRPNYMTVPATLRELEKIEMVRLTDNRYHLDHAITATQKTILKSFDIDAHLVKHYAEDISRMLKEGR